MYNVLLRMFGARIGRNVRFRTWCVITELDCVDVGDDTIVDMGASLEPASIKVIPAF